MKLLLLSLSVATAALPGADVWYGAWLLPEAQVLCGIDVRRVKLSPVGKAVMLQGVPAQMQFPKAGDFDAWRDVDEYLEAIYDAGKLALVKGPHRPGQMPGMVTGTLTPRGQMYEGTAVMAWAGGDRKDELWALWQNGVAAIGPPDLIRRLLQQRKTGRVALTVADMQRIERMRGGEAWTWIKKSSSLDRLPLLATLALNRNWWRVVPYETMHAKDNEGIVRGVVATAHLGSQVSVRVDFETGGGMPAELLTALLRAASLFDTVLGEPADSVRAFILKNLQVSREGNIARCEWRLGAEEFERALAVGWIKLRDDERWPRPSL